MADDVSAYPYGTLPNRLAIRIKKNRLYMNGRYCSLALPTCSLTEMCIVVTALSNPILHREGTIRLELTDRKCSPRNTITTRTEYSPRLVSVRLDPRRGASRLISFVTSNWSRGDDTKNEWSILNMLAVKAMFRVKGPRIGKASEHQDTSFIVSISVDRWSNYK